MRHEWLLAAKRAEVVMEWEKGKGDKEWRKQKYKKRGGLFTKSSSQKLLSHLKSISCRPLFFCLFLSHKLQTETDSLSTPECHRRHQLHTQGQSQARMSYTVTLQQSCGVIAPFLTSCKLSQTNTNIKDKICIQMSCSRLETLQSDDVCLTCWCVLQITQRCHIVAGSSIHQNKGQIFVPFWWSACGQSVMLIRPYRCLFCICNMM